MLDFQSIILNQIFKINTLEKELCKYKSNQSSKMQSDDNIIKVTKEININRASRIRQDILEKEQTYSMEKNSIRAHDEKINVLIAVLLYKFRIWNLWYIQILRLKI
jgi:hypothetical protein